MRATATQMKAPHVNEVDNYANRGDGDTLKASGLSCLRRDSTRVDATTATTRRRQRAAFLQWLQSFTLFTATNSHFGSGQGSFLKFTVC